MTFRVATYNAGLAVGLLPHATERADRVIEALAGLDLDLLFVQEFWLDPHWDALCRKLQPKYGHAMRPDPLLPPTHAACKASDVEPLVGCAHARCAGLTDEALARCMVQSCASTALSLPTRCLNCIASHPIGTIEAIVGRCVGETAAATPESARSAAYGGLIAYGGSFGTGLLSRTPLHDVELLVFESSVNARGAIHVRVTTGGLGELHVFAAHLSPGGAEHGVQLEQLIEFADARAGGEPALLVGDLNTTPESAAFRALARAGFRESDPPDRRATYTHDGLVTAEVPVRGIRLDHVLVRNTEARLSSERVLDRPVDLEVKGKRVRCTLSDHFGVLATLTPDPKR